MRCTNRFRLLIALLVCLAGRVSISAQVFWSESFFNEATAIANWVNGGTNPGPVDWAWTMNPAEGYQDPDLPPFAAPSATDGYFYFNSADNGLVPHDVWLTGTGNPADCSGKQDVRLRFFTQYIYFNPSGTVAEVGVSTDGVNFTYTPLFAGLPANLPYHDWVEVDLDEADDQPQVWLQFRWIGNFEYHWKVDDLALISPSFANPADSCDTAVDIAPYFGQTPGVPQITGLFDNTNATASPNDPEVSCWNEAGNNGLDILNTTLWFTFSGDGDIYDIQTVPCNAANYIGTAQNDKGDTQMLVYAGQNCTDLTPVQCNDDLFLTGMPDFRAGVTLETTPGQQYFLLIDGFDNQGVVAAGEFCIQITRTLAVACNAGRVGGFTMDNGGYLCVGENLIDLLAIEADSFVLPTVGPQNGLAWCFSPAPLEPGIWPGSIPGIASTPFAHNLGLPSFINNGSTLDHGAYYLTPVVLGGGTLINAGALPYVFNVNPDSGCFFVGQSQLLQLLPALDPLMAGAQTTPEVIPPGQNGAIELTVAGGAGQYLNDAALYKYAWSNGKTTKDINGLAAGAYTVTISDVTGCMAPIVLTDSVGVQSVGTSAPAFASSFRLIPNPAHEVVYAQLTLGNVSETVQVELCNLHGQVLLAAEAGPAKNLNLPLGVGRLPEGLYLVRWKTGGQSGLKPIVIQH